jgi:hypothetical protein
MTPESSFRRAVDDSGVVPIADDSGVVLRTIATAVIESAATKAAWGMRQ